MSIKTELQRISQAKADIRSAIEAKGVTVDENAAIDTYASKIDEIQSGGMSADFEWAKHTETLDVSSLNWGTETTEMNIPNVKTIRFPLSVSNTVVKHLVLNLGIPITTLNRAFYWASNGGVIEHLTINGDTSKATSFRQMIYGGSYLRSVDGSPLDFSSSSDNSNMFVGCPSVSYIRVVQNSIKVSANFSGSKSWDNDSIQSIIAGLAPMPSDNPQTLTMSSDLKENIESNTDWLNTITSRNWSLAFA